MYDLIGDTHGYADPLRRLLDQLGYQRKDGGYRHPERKAIFLGDFVDRGPAIREVLQIVRPMVESGAALAVMGNHELNLLAFHTEDPERPGEHLRRRTPDNTRQVRQTLAQLSAAELSEALDWFRTLPLWLELEGLRVVHACWDEVHLEQVRRGLEQYGGVTAGFLQAAYRQERELFRPVEVILKGKEIALPEGVSFQDKDGKVRRRTRTRWYMSPAGMTYRTYALSDAIHCDDPLDPAALRDVAPYPTTSRPVFVGHYCLSATPPSILCDNVACLDYGVIKDGPLCGYRWNGEQTLNNDHFVWVNQ